MDHNATIDLPLLVSGDREEAAPLDHYYGAMIRHIASLGRAVKKIKRVKEKKLVAQCCGCDEHRLIVTTKADGSQVVKFASNHAVDCPPGSLRENSYNLMDLAPLAPRLYDDVYLRALSTKKDGAKELKAMVKTQAKMEVGVRQCRRLLDSFKLNFLDYMAHYRLLQSAIEQFKAQDPEGRYEVVWDADGTLKSVYICPSHCPKNFRHLDGPISADGASPRVRSRRAQSAVGRGVLQAVDTPTLPHPPTSSLFLGTFLKNPT